MPPLSLMIPVVVGLIIIFVIIALVLRMMLRGHVDLAMKRVQKLNEDNLRREVELKRKLDEAEKEYNQKKEAASRDADRIKEDGKRLAQELKEKAQAEAHRERNEIIADARDDAERLKRSVISEMDKKILATAAELLKSLLTQQLSREMHEHFINQVLVSFKKEKRPLDVTTDTASVISAQPLTDEHKKQLVNILAEKTGKKIKLKETVDADRNIAGIYIKLDNLVIDGTLRQRLDHIITQVKTGLKA